MARGNRTYKRDSNGRFASTGGGGKRSRPAAKRVERGPNKLTRDNSGKITSVGGNGATARGGRLRTASGNLRATQTTRIAGGRAGMVGKGGKLKGSKVLPTTRLTDSSRLPASQRPGSMTNTLRGVMGSLAKQDAKRIREVEAITGQKVRATKSNVGTAASNRVKAAGAGSKSVSQTLRAGLRELAQSDARTMRGMAEIVRNSTPKLPGGKKAVGAGKAKALAAGKKGAAKNISLGNSALTKAERVVERIKRNEIRAQRESRSKKEERKLARSLAVSQFAKSFVSERSVGNRDPGKQYSKADLLPQLNKYYARPTPKKSKKSTLKADPSRGLIGVAVGAAMKARSNYRQKGLLMPPGASRLSKKAK
jgi:hypothetical protein